jgi:hypothetical protein
MTKIKTLKEVAHLDGLKVLLNLLSKKRKKQKKKW